VPDLRSRIQGYGSTTSARIQNSYAASAGLTSASAGLTSSKGESFSTGNIGKYGGFGSDDVHRAERAGNSWLAAAQVGQVATPLCRFLWRLDAMSNLKKKELLLMEHLGDQQLGVLFV
jgi:hypothetical protein